MDVIIGLGVILLLFYILIKGGIQTFKRNWGIALVLFVLLTPIWFLWATVEIFIELPTVKPLEVNVTINKTDEKV
jgi:4-amino-4-deoxy-L-arabinose transferase-like glycosyltransferase